MIRSVLIDLDDTLLENKMDRFLPAYFQRLGDYLSDLVEPSRMLAALMKGTQAMLTNQDPSITLERVFADVYYPELGLDEAALHDRLRNFYSHDFNELQSLTAQRPAAVEFIKALFEDGYEVVVATNPLFPGWAMEARLRWAGASIEEYPFTLITSYEMFHFTKANPAYYAEILGLLGLSPTDAVMIGNDISNDIEPAYSLGMPVFHLHDQPSERFPGGDYGSARRWLASAEDSADKSAVTQPAVILARLKGHLSALLTLSRRPDSLTWRRRPAADEWAPIEIVAHLADVEKEVNLPRVMQFTGEPNPHLAAFDTDVWADERGYIEYDPARTLEGFVTSRIALIAALEDLEPDAWMHTGVHALLGPTTLNELTNIVVEHDLLHLAQMRRTIGYPG